MHIPFFARGPGIMPGTRLTALGANIDITPTFIDIAGLPPHPEHDGKSLMPLLLSSQLDDAPAPVSVPRVTQVDKQSAEAGWRTSLIIEYLSVGTYYVSFDLHHTQHQYRSIVDVSLLRLNSVSCSKLLAVATFGGLQNDHAKIWLAGPWGNGSLVEYGQGPFSPDPTFVNSSNCPTTEGVGGVGEGKCYFVDSEASNNWIAHRVRNATHNYVYAESYGKQAMHAPTPVRTFSICVHEHALCLAHSNRPCAVMRMNVFERLADMGCRYRSILDITRVIRMEWESLSALTVMTASASCTTTGQLPPTTLTFP